MPDSECTYRSDNRIAGRLFDAWGCTKLSDNVKKSSRSSGETADSSAKPSRSLGLVRASRWRSLEKRFAFDGAGGAAVVEVVADADAPGAPDSSVQSLDDAARQNQSAAVPDTSDSPDTTDAMSSVENHQYSIAGDDVSGGDVDAENGEASGDDAQTEADDAQTDADDGIDAAGEGIDESDDGAFSDEGFDDSSVADEEIAADVDAEPGMVTVAQRGLDEIDASAENESDDLYMGDFGVDDESDAVEAFMLDDVADEYTQIVFVDQQITDYSLFVDEMADDIALAEEDELDASTVDGDFVVGDVRIIVLENDRSGLDQITEILASEKDLDAVHIVSHGVEGHLRIGDEWVSEESVDQSADQIASWKSALSEDADILIYGCDLTATESGQRLVHTIGQLTGADVAASNDQTGTQALGGNWVLEFEYGEIEASALAIAGGSWTGLLDPFVVTTTADTGGGSLREAIELANNFAGADEITFAIGADDARHFYYQDDGIAGQVSASNIQTTTEIDDANIGDIDPDFAKSWYSIDLKSGLPGITDTVTIDGTTQSGYDDSPIIEIDGTNAGENIDGLGIFDTASGTEIRGLVVGGFSESGIESAADDVVIAGNYIGTDVSGLIANGNGNEGVAITGDNTLIGGSTEADRNVISGNEDDGIGVSGDAVGTSIRLNYIGTGATGYTSLGNGDDGISLVNGSGTSIVDNVISGNVDDGIMINPLANDVNITANLIGTNKDATASIGNASDGILIEGDNVTVGGDLEEHGNVISGNGGDGVEVAATTNSITIQNNFIGTNSEGTMAISNAFAGVRITQPGDAIVVADNVISGNGGFGIVLTGSGNGSVITGNMIGTGSAGTEELGNADGGIHIRDGASDNEIGTELDPNVIANNGYTGLGYGGISVDGDTSVNNAFIANSIYNNQGLAIDLMEGGQTGSTDNDAGDIDTGPNLLQNTPVLANAVLEADNTITVEITMDGLPNTEYRVDLYGTTTPDGSGAGELEIYLGYAQVQTGADGLSTISANVAAAGLVAGNAISATASVINGNNKPVDTSEAAVNTTITAANAPPEIVENMTVPVDEGLTTVVILTATDPDTPASQLVYTIVGGRDAAFFDIDQNNTLVFKNSPDFENPLGGGNQNDYIVEVEVSDGQGGTDMITVTAQVQPVNDAEPIISSNGGADVAIINVAEGTSAVTTVVASDGDLPGQTVTYSIGGGSEAALFSIDNATGDLSFINAPDFSNPQDANANNVYLVTVVASDGTLSDSQDLTINVTNTNSAPVITSNNGADTATFNHVEGRVDVTAVVATDPDAGDTVSYSIVGGDDAALFSVDPVTGAVTFDVAPNFESANDSDSDNVYIVVIQAQDDDGETDTQTIEVTVIDQNEAPVIQTAGGIIDVNEGSTAVTQVIAADVDQGDTKTWSLTGADASLFAIDATGAVTFLNGPDFENPQDQGGDNDYNITVEVTDAGGLTATQDLVVRVGGLNEVPEIVSNGGDITAAVSVLEGTTAVTTVQATDPDLPVQNLSYSIDGGSDASMFTIDSATGALNFVSAPDFASPGDADGDNVYEVVVRVSDNNGGADSQTLSVSVTDVLNDPVITSYGGGDSAVVTVNENIVDAATVVATDADLPNDTLTYSIIGGADGSFFSIDPATGDINFGAEPDFENPVDVNGDNQYEVIVQVADSSGRTDTQALTINVVNANENPIVTSHNGDQQVYLSVSENSTAVTTISAINVDDPSVPLTYTIFGTGDAKHFQIDSSTGELSFQTPPDFENPADGGADNTYEVLVTISNGTGGLTSQFVAVTVTGINEDPVIVSAGGGTSASIGMFEGGTGVDTVVAVDNDRPVQEISYSISGGVDADLFTIDRDSGVLKLIEPLGWQEESDNVYYVEVSASDGAGGVDSFQYNVYILQTPASERLPEPEPPVEEPPEPLPLPQPTPPMPSAEPVQTEKADSSDDVVVEDDGESEDSTAADDEEPFAVFVDSEDSDYDSVSGSFQSNIENVRKDIRDLTQSVQDELDLVSARGGVILLPTFDTITDDLFLNELIPLTISDTGISAQAADVYTHVEEVSSRIDTLISRMAQQMREDVGVLVESPAVATAVVGATMTLSVGYASWLLRFGYLLTGALTFLPTLRSFDPIPVLAADHEQEIENIESSENLSAADRELRAIFKAASLDSETIEFIPN